MSRRQSARQGEEADGGGGFYGRVGCQLSDAMTQLFGAARKEETRQYRVEMLEQRVAQLRAELDFYERLLRFEEGR